MKEMMRMKKKNPINIVDRYSGSWFLIDGLESHPYHLEIIWLWTGNLPSLCLSLHILKYRY